MTVDKFGRHQLSQSSTTYSNIASPQSAPFYICDPTILHSKTVIKVTGHKDDLEIGFYKLDNQTDEYIFPISGKIENLQIFPNDCEMFLGNSGKAFHAKDLIGQDINKGQKINFIFKQDHLHLYVQFVIQCPITKNVS